MSRHYHVLLSYHMVFITKYRHETIVSHDKTICKYVIEKLCERMNIYIDEIAIEPDHVHLMFTLTHTTYSIPEIAKKIKGVTSRALNLFNDTVGQPYFARGYYCCTVGFSAAELVKRYIQEHDDSIFDIN